jgi:cytochrome bd ubiquinol oxidase subunit I
VRRWSGPLFRFPGCSSPSPSHFTSFLTICLAAWLALLEACHLATRKPVYRRSFEFWKIFGVTFGLSVVSGIVLAFEFGMNWCGLSEVTGRIQGPLLTYESFTAFCAGGVFLFGVLIFGRNRCRRWSICFRP